MSGRLVTASQRCRPLSSRQDICGGLLLPPPCPRIYGFVKARRGAEARPAVGEFDVGLAAPAGFPLCAVEGKPGRAPRGCGDSGSRTEGHEAWLPSLCCLAPEDFWVESLQVPPCLAGPQPTRVSGCTSPLPLPCRFICLECQGVRGTHKSATHPRGLGVCTTFCEGHPLSPCCIQAVPDCLLKVPHPSSSSPTSSHLVCISK